MDGGNHLVKGTLILHWEHLLCYPELVLLCYFDLLLEVLEPARPSMSNILRNGKVVTYKGDHNPTAPSSQDKSQITVVASVQPGHSCLQWLFLIASLCHHVLLMEKLQGQVMVCHQKSGLTKTFLMGGLRAIFWSTLCCCLTVIPATIARTLWDWQQRRK